jgi:phage major head subunit gpT-like protein
LESVYYNLDARYRAGYTGTDTWWQEVATRVPSSTRETRYGWMVNIPRFREWLGERVVHNLAARNYAIVNKDWELTLGVDRNDIEDDQMGLYGPRAEEMGQQARKLWDDLVTKLIKEGATTVAFDGQYFFDTDHPVNMDDASYGTYSNLLTSTPLTYDNYVAARKKMRTFKSDNGRPMAVRPNILLVPPSLEPEALKIQQAELVATAAGNTSVTNVFRNTARIIVADELEDEPDAWYLLDTSRPIRPFVVQVRKEPELVSLVANTDYNVFHHKRFLYGLDGRGNAGYGLPFLALRRRNDFQAPLSEVAGFSELHPLRAQGPRLRTKRCFSQLPWGTQMADETKKHRVLVVARPLGPDYPGVWSAGRFWQAGENQEVEVSDDELAILAARPNLTVIENGQVVKTKPPPPAQDVSILTRDELNALEEYRQNRALDPKVAEKFKSAQFERISRSEAQKRLAAEPASAVGNPAAGEGPKEVGGEPAYPEDKGAHRREETKRK